MKRIFYILVAIFLATGGICTSCVNEEIDGPLLKGESKLSLDIAFRPLNDPLTTRTVGDAIKHINDLSIVIYKSDGSLYSNTHYTNADSGENTFTTTDVEPENYPVSEDPNRNGFAEETTCKTSTITMEQMPYGKYRMYAVANLGRVLTEDETETEDALKSIQLTWNSENIAANNAMFGFFDTETNKATVKTQAPEITINDLEVSLHAWVKRAASKVTIAYDGSNLNENVYIYIHSAQIKDIPKYCLLGKDNIPDSADELIADGEMMDYQKEQRVARTNGLVITKGNPLQGTHLETDNALFFFENMQGDAPTDKTGGFGKLQDETGDGLSVTNPNGSDPSDKDYKDGIKFGSYIEVKGYYVNKTATNASQGDIIYRFMLGKDVVRDCNAERNNHYKLTLKFKNDANNPDWHIEYAPESPELSAPAQLYISYGYNEQLNIPVVVRSASVNTSTTVTATIIENNWGYPEHKYFSTSNHTGNEDGFLSFENKKGTVSISADDREKWNQQGSSFQYFGPSSLSTDACSFSIPVYTRPLILGNSLTGHNPYVSYQRTAKVKFVVVIDGKTYEQETEVIQVRRLVNPAGVWRSDNNTTPFNIRLMELEFPDTDANGQMVEENFIAPLSDGPWTAHIEEGADWVEISPTGGTKWGTEDITGGTGSEIRFDYRPKNVNTTGNVRCGVIKVTYHNNQCVHYVFVSQGNYGTVNLAGTKWQNRNVQEMWGHVANPLLEGSMFKFGYPWIGILSVMNHEPGYGPYQDCWGKYFLCTDKDANGDYNSHMFEELISNLDVGFTGDRNFFPGSTIRPARYEEWKALETLHRRYGIMYGDECTETMTTTTDAYTYYKEGQKRGMQGMFVWDESREGNHVFFPIGSTGHGHRKVNDNANGVFDNNGKYNILHYAQRPAEMEASAAVNNPMYYDLWERKGAIYWYETEYYPAVEFSGTETYGSAHDINFHTMLLQTYGQNAIDQNQKEASYIYDGAGNVTTITTSTDACFVRCVEE